MAALVVVSGGFSTLREEGRGGAIVRKHQTKSDVLSPHCKYFFVAHLLSPYWINKLSMVHAPLRRLARESPPTVLGSDNFARTAAACH